MEQTPKPTPEHLWLKQLVGDWSFESRGSMGNEDDVVELRGTESVRMLGDLWILSDMDGAMPGGERCTAVMTIGFDPDRNLFIGTWVGSMMTSMFHYEGSLDEGRRVLTLNTSGPHFANPAASATYRDIIELNDDGTRTMRSEILLGDGSWQTFNRGVFHRTSGSG
ncbi:MAG: DUF1579 domain-containing protein [Planctomycetota bacterium]